jgi:6-phosphogluconolactonase/glucosamine-6-phosphate isomerase/deaminase
MITSLIFLPCDQQLLVEYHKKGELTFKHVVTFNMDEYVGMYQHSNRNVTLK